ncbi:NUDIX hydrolase [Deinococcus cellulosilyticus]|uniref:DNA mismatch repair protein MutT n=1 Tax=Deinococcus cellulosilyticus (strain DSM 18568 / NBRC 106333 / KACC 11606 / 5516J-15) TaxID=1223518 RepID=A0A511N3K8_DEIC1|nr:NUDIX domain-containing protein [Deinococcus cellulosilyticus]GEM47453.1 DNA mismatch repair protein MutT [Deinococcus cellulosilyticus NBRC 106333 = KACC 11606]
MQRVRAILIEKDHVALIHREKMLEGAPVQYYVFPGGGIEAGETPEEGVRREILEELGLEIEVSSLFAELHGQSHEGFFVCKVRGGTFGTGQGPEFSGLGNGTYTPVWVPLSRLADLPVLPEAVKTRLLETHF